MVLLPPILYLDQVMPCAPCRLYIKKAQAARFTVFPSGRLQSLGVHPTGHRLSREGGNPGMLLVRNVAG
jgi:hypothetical protein